MCLPQSYEVAEVVKKVFQEERLACVRAQRCERTWHVVGTEGKSLWLRAGPSCARKEGRKGRENDWRGVRLETEQGQDW